MKIRELRLKNYRSFEDCTIHFEDYYTAICGKNNSGKSNIIRAIINTLDRSRYYDRFNYSSDYPVWKQSSKEETIEICTKLFLDKEADYGLLKFIGYFLSESKKEDVEIDIVDTIIQINFKLGYKEAKSEIIVNDKLIDNKYKVAEILRRIHFAPVISFHNSTQTGRPYRRSSHGYLENLSSKSKEAVDNRIKQINNELSKALQKHKSELQSIIGRLQEKYEVGLTFSGIDIDFERIPYEISLGEKSFDLPLDDWGSGTKNRTLILSSIFDAKNQIGEEESNRITPIVVIEEPESFLHPSAQAEFGRVLQDLSQELEIQVVATTHSPYLLSHHNPKSNLLLNRKKYRNKARESYIESVDSENWRKPFELALGMVGPEFESLKEAFFSNENSIILVEGKLDVEYFEILRNKKHGENTLKFKGEFYPYGGFGFLNNPVLLKFMKDRFNNFCVTLDLDAITQVKKSFDTAGYKKNTDYFTVGIDKPGYRFIEGLIPDFIRSKVNASNPELIFALQSESKEERKSAKDRLKEMYLTEFKKDMKYTEKYFGEFYKLTKMLNKVLK
ncbi:MAG: ATP-binding protein [Clostridiaceae bacterium]|nr:ATP-binding protein [Clostridiaceae bacterium]